VSVISSSYMVIGMYIHTVQHLPKQIIWSY
jgi:hypothetical protein